MGGKAGRAVASSMQMWLQVPALATGSWQAQLHQPEPLHHLHRLRHQGLLHLALLDRRPRAL